MTPSGEWRLVVLDAAGKGAAEPVTLRGAEGLGEPTSLVPSPEANLVAVTTHDLRNRPPAARRSYADALVLAQFDEEGLHQRTRFARSLRQASVLCSVLLVSRFAVA